MGQAITKNNFARSMVLLSALPLIGRSHCRRFAEGILEHDARAASRLAAFFIPIPQGRDGDWLAGDLHCHVTPPDGPGGVQNNFDATMAMARAEGLDFVVLAPHVRRRFYEYRGDRERVAVDQRQLAARAKSVSDIVVIPGIEYTDPASGHIGVSFVDLASVLATDEPFFRAVARRGGILNLHHPFALPFRVPFIRRVSPDMSWRPFTSAAQAPPEIAFVNSRYNSIEVFNHPKSVIESITHRDRFVHVRRALAQTDAEVVRRGRPIAVVGGSDNHAFSLRATTYVFAETRDRSGIARAVRAAHTCAMGPDACSLQVRSNLDASWKIVGDTILATAGDEGWVEVRWRGRGTIVANGGAVYRGRGPLRLRVSGNSFIRLEAATSFSSHVAIRALRSP